MSRPRTPEMRREADSRGREGEAEAALWLARQGWQILAERVKTRAGEIDLIARRAGLVAFVEVKWRARAAALAMLAGASYRVIPWQMAFVAKLLRAAPNWAFDRLMAGRPYKPRKTEPSP